MVSGETQPIDFLNQFDSIKKDLANKKLLIFLDYDGTLTPIVDTPDLAVLSDDVQKAVQQCASKHTVSIVSGRATDDVKEKVSIDGIFYAGSHGFEIIDPQGNITINEEAKHLRGLIKEAYRDLCMMLRGLRGALVEDVKYTISAHYRLVEEEKVIIVKSAVEKILQRYNTLKMSEGKMVFEIRPTIDWDKGKAVDWILDVLNFNPDEHVAIYIGDDTTDEDAFDVIADKGFGILVAEEMKPTRAKYFVKDTSDVKKVIEGFNNL